jgi:protein-disulfide isomerase
VHIFKRLTTTAFAATLLLATPAAASNAAPKLPFSPDQKAAMEDFIRDFILDNPEVLMESVNRFKEREEKRQDEDALSAITRYKDFLYNNKDMPQAGNLKADITVVEFFDYNCGYCKRAYEAVQETIDKDKNVRFVFVELPILSETSRNVAEWAMAAHKQGKYFEFHREAMLFAGPRNEAAMEGIAKKLGLDVNQMKKDAKSQETQALLEKKVEVAQALRITGTPGFIIGDQIVRGYVPYEGMKAIIADARKNKK